MTSVSARVTSPDLGMGIAYPVLSQQMLMTENTERLFGVILDVVQPIFVMGKPSVIFVFLHVALFQRSACLIFCTEQLESCRAIHRVADKATHR